MLNLQDPSSNGSPSLRDTFVREAESWKSVRGAFAWATSKGLNEVFLDDDFAGLLGEGTEDSLLIFGVDFVTTPDALDMMDEMNSETSIETKVFHPKGGGYLFHPKYTIWGDGSTGSLVIGSGNLTRGGIRDSHEAFARLPLQNEEYSSVLQEWENWLKRHEEDLYAPTNDRVRRQAESNTGWGSSPSDGSGTTSSDQNGEADVLVAELPKNGARLKQANFSKAVFTGYFGVSLGAVENRLFRCSPTEDELWGPEKRRAVRVDSSNFRFELSAADGMEYPEVEEVGRPIGVFLKKRPDAFLYRLVLPTHDDRHEKLETFLEEKKGPRSKNKCRRVTANLDECEDLEDVQELLEHQGVF